MIRFLRQPKLWVTLASVVFIAVAALQQGDQLRQQNLDGRGWLWLVLGFGFSWLSIVINGVSWRVLVGWLGHSTDRFELIPLFVRTNVLKYLPGGIWHLVERIRVLRPAIGGGTALAGVILDPLLIVAAASLLLIAGGWQSGLLLLAPLPALLLLLPRWRELILRRLERSKAAQLETQGVGELQVLGRGRDGCPWIPLAAELAFVLVRFAGFACCLLAFDLTPPALPLWLAAFALAYAVGLVVPGAPGGMGVFEATLLLRLGSSVDEPALLAMVLSYRVISTLADLLAAAVLAADQSLIQRLRPNA